MRVKIVQKVSGYREVGKVIEVDETDQFILALINKGYLMEVDAETPVDPPKTVPWSYK